MREDEDQDDSLTAPAYALRQQSNYDDEDKYEDRLQPTVNQVAKPEQLFAHDDLVQETSTLDKGSS